MPKYDFLQKIWGYQKKLVSLQHRRYNICIKMEFNNELLDQIIESAESLKALSMSVEVGEYKGWTVRVSLEKPNSGLEDFHKI